LKKLFIFNKKLSMDCDEVDQSREMDTDNRTETQELETKSVEDGKESKEMDEDPPVPALSINTGANSGWKYWCHQCDEIIDAIPVVRNDGSLECPKCKENVVEKIAPDDDFLEEDFEEKVPQHAQASTSPLSLQFLRRIGMPDNVAQHIIGSAGQSGVQYYVGRANNPQQALQQNPISAFFQGIGPGNEGGGVGFNRFVHQFDRLFMGGAPGSPVNAEQAFQGLDFGALFGLGHTGSFGGQRLNPSDYGIGFNGLRDILGRLQREGGPRGPPPAAKKVVENLKEEKFSEDKKDQETACAICKDEFKQGDTVIKFPCPNKHLYHGACIQPWLKLHNSCPVCRFELATDDELYERMKEIRENMLPDNNANNNNNPPPPAPSG